MKPRSREHRSRPSQGSPRRRQQIPGQFAPRLIEMLESPAWRVLTKSAQRVIDRIDIELAHHGGTRIGNNENGRLPVTYGDFASYGIDRHAINPAICEAVALGFIEVTERGRAGNREFRRPSVYRLTFRPSDGDIEFGTNEWRRIDTMERAREVKAIARKAANDREAAKAQQKKQKSSGGKRPFSVGGSLTENTTIPVGGSPTTGPVGEPPPLSISRGAGWRSAPFHGAVASQPAPGEAGLFSPRSRPSDPAAEERLLAAIMQARGCSRSEAVAIFGSLDNADGAPPVGQRPHGADHPADDLGHSHPLARGTQMVEPPSSAATTAPAATAISEAIPAFTTNQSSLAELAGFPMMMLQKWGLTRDKARGEVNRLITAAGDRAAGLNELLLKMESRSYLDCGRKVAWLRSEANKMIKHPRYWPVFRAQRSGTNSAEGAVIAAIQAAGGRASMAVLIAATGKTRASITALTISLVRAGRIMRVAPGIFAPQGVANYVRARAAILSLLMIAPSSSATIGELIAATGKSRSSLNAAIEQMRHSGVLAPLSRRGQVALSAASLAKIKRREAIRDGRGSILWAPDAARQGTA